jgi:phosphate transport system ATP-binding protein
VDHLPAQELKVMASTSPDAAPPNVLQVRDLTVSIDGRSILKPSSLTLPANVILAIIGTSGCGKSVLLKSLTGQILEEAEKVRIGGTITLLGRSATDDPEWWMGALRRQMVYVSQHPQLFPTDVHGNVAAALQYWAREDKRPLSKREIDDRVEEALRKACLWDEVRRRLRRPASELSSGQQQRLCVARALALKPAVLLLDEPTAHLDHVGIAKFEEVLNSVRNTTSIIIVTHGMHQAARVSQQTVHMHPGRIIETGDTDRIFTNPTDKLTEDFIVGRYG